MAHDIFISYSSLDKSFADAACAVLERAGIRCWMAPRDILPGQQWGDAILRAIKGSKAMVLVFSASANVSPQIQREVERAVSHGVAIVPLRIEDVQPTHSLEYFLSTPHWLDAFSPPLDQHLARLVIILKPMIEALVTNSEPVVSTGSIDVAQRPDKGRYQRQEVPLTVPETLSITLSPGLRNILNWIKSHLILSKVLLIAISVVPILCLSLFAIWPSSPAETSPGDIVQTVATSLDREACSWLDVDMWSGVDGQRGLMIRGVAQTPGAISAIASSAAGDKIDLDVSKVYPLPQTACAVVDAFRHVRTSRNLPQMLSLKHSDYQLSMDAGPCQLKGRWAMVTYSIKDGPEDFAVIGMEATGKIQRLDITRARLSDLVKSQPNYFSRAADGSVDVGLCVDEESLHDSRGLLGVALVMGDDLSDLAVSSTALDHVSDQWISDFAAKANANGWHTEMAWFYIHS